jgi:hypothetical protein
MPFVIPPLLKLALGALGAGALVSWVLKETRRVNKEIERANVSAFSDPGVRRSYPTLRRDQRTDQWRVM